MRNIYFFFLILIVQCASAKVGDTLVIRSTIKKRYKYPKQNNRTIVQKRI
jgi:hypothetical protein